MVKIERAKKTIDCFIEYPNKIMKENYRANLTTGLRVKYITKTKNSKFDPMETFIDGGESISLPVEWNNFLPRHNRSIQWLNENI